MMRRSRVDKSLLISSYIIVIRFGGCITRFSSMQHAIRISAHLVLWLECITGQKMCVFMQRCACATD